MSSKQHDIKVINKTLSKLSRSRNIIRFLVSLLIIGLWAWGAYELYKYSQTIDYKPLTQYSEQVVKFLEQYGKYIWIGIIALISLIVLYAISSWISGSIARAGEIIPPYDAVNELICDLSTDGRRVLNWVWNTQREPITIKDIRETKTQLKNDRLELLNIIEKEANLLGIVPEHLSNDKNHMMQTNRLLSERQKVDRLLGGVDLELEEQNASARAKSIATPVSQPAIKTQPQPVHNMTPRQYSSQPTVQPVNQTTAQPVQGTVAQHVAKPTSQPKTQQAQRPVAQPVHQTNTRTINPATTHVPPQVPSVSEGFVAAHPHTATLVNAQQQAQPQQQTQFQGQYQGQQQAQTQYQAQTSAGVRVEPTIQTVQQQPQPYVQAQPVQQPQPTQQPQQVHTINQQSDDVPLANPEVRVPKVNFINNPKNK
ncbi:hypothetical protein [Taylorella equigenitalis]|uniref:Putative membrane protein n=1 Tax=Taylorella equigenitalis 14/56 TaxID=1091497 RepID=I7IZE3_9BURK|nr:hypothetical protein [Taylorella equigenitalis]ASY37130.1 hypothetical protein CA605_00125 [Taylorella equigenitalis]ASY40120.1 hypothetical protein CAV20_00125 [Taylorella equigenitalis]ASY41555.1 hypothetical protein CA943_00125 [Taylorella equigenitalis]KGK33617.1 hypothetical protein LW90_03210 [Taylorella equigenitalis]RBA27063.1 hypothetical protein DQW13_01090 [Taylorella equigenitalis]